MPSIDVASATHKARHAAGGADPLTPADIGAVPASRWLTGTGSPEGVVTAPIGTTYTNTTTGEEWHKRTGTGNTGWRGPLVMADDPRLREMCWVALNAYGATSNMLTLGPAWAWTSTGGSSIRICRTGSRVTLRVVGNLQCTGPANTETDLFVEDFPSGYRMTYEMVPLAHRTAGAGLAQIGAGMGSGNRFRVLTTASPFIFGYTQISWTTDNTFPA